MHYPAVPVHPQSPWPASSPLHRWAADCECPSEKADDYTNDYQCKQAPAGGHDDDPNCREKAPGGNDDDGHG